MDFSSYPILTLLALFFFVLGILSLGTLWNYFFGGGNPLVQNVEARVEAAQNPANLMNDWRRFRRRRIMSTSVFVLLIILVCVVVAPAASATIARGLWLTGETIFGFARDSILEFVDQLNG